MWTHCMWTGAPCCAAEFNDMTIGIGPIKPWCLHSEWAFNGVHDDPTPQFKEPMNEIWG